MNEEGQRSTKSSFIYKSKAMNKKQKLVYRLFEILDQRISNTESSIGAMKESRDDETKSRFTILALDESVDLTWDDP